MPRSNPTIERDILTQIQMVDFQMKSLAEEATRRRIAVGELKDATGQPLMVPLLQIRSNLVLAEVMLKRQ